MCSFDFVFHYEYSQKDYILEIQMQLVYLRFPEGMMLERMMQGVSWLYPKRFNIGGRRRNEWTLARLVGHPRCSPERLVLAGVCHHSQTAY